MSDVIDTANETAEMNIQSAIANRPQTKVFAPKGSCYNCDEPIDAPKLFCDVDCRDDYEREKEAKARNGRM